ncbi:MAG: D-alanyl-D-alanine carboxypeptidase [Clostridia bacterium]|nr:D-alanyl-D-alanine carboxypeptidase [Clostridia bacterium]
MKKLGLLLLCIVLVMGKPIAAEALSVSAKYACVLDAQTGKILYEKNAYDRHSMASTTKIMTALVALERGNTEDIVTVSKNAAGTEGSSIYLKAGEKITLGDLLYGVMLASGNDAAIAVAEHIGGSVSGFADLMNQKAKEIGAKNTQFKNPNGLDEEGHYTTAYDLALITKEALANPKFTEIASTWNKKISNGEESYLRVLTNHNKLLKQYEGCIGVKTGYTKKTGRCLVSAAERDNLRLIAVTLSAPDDWRDHTNMLNDAFSKYSAKPMILKDMEIKTVPVISGDKERIRLLAEDDFYTSGVDDKDWSLDISVPENVPAPIKQGTALGTLKILYQGKLMKEIRLCAEEDVTFVEPPKKTFGDHIRGILICWLGM